MKVERQEISKKLKMLKGITPSKNISNISGVLFKNNMLMATNLDISVTTKIDVESDEQFVIPLVAIEIIENLSDNMIELKEKNNRITVLHSNGKSTFSTISVNEFPEIPNISIEESKTAINYDGETIIDAINNVMYACNPNVQKPVLSGILLEGDGSKLNIVACDGFRIAWNQIDFDGELSVIIPKTTLQKVLSLGIKESIRLYKTARNKAVFKVGEYTVYTNLLEGEFISYKSMFNNTFPTTIEIDRIDFLNSISRSLICSEETKQTPTQTPTVLESDFQEDTKNIGRLLISRNSATTEFIE